MAYWAVSHVSGSHHRFSECVVETADCPYLKLFVILSRRETSNMFSLWKELEDCCQTLFKRDRRAEILNISAIEELAVGLIQQSAAPWSDIPTHIQRAADLEPLKAHVSCYRDLSLCCGAEVSHSVGKNGLIYFVTLWLAAGSSRVLMCIASASGTTSVCDGSLCPCFVWMLRWLFGSSSVKQLAYVSVFPLKVNVKYIVSIWLLN